MKLIGGHSMFSYPLSWLYFCISNLPQGEKLEEGQPAEASVWLSLIHMEETHWKIVRQERDGPGSALFEFQCSSSILQLTRLISHHGLGYDAVISNPQISVANTPTCTSCSCYKSKTGKQGLSIDPRRSGTQANRGLLSTCASSITAASRGGKW